MNTSEDFLHFVWKFRLFDQGFLSTTEGKPIRIIHVGEHNRHAGPDFENAQVSVDGTTWAGSVEIHICSSDWARHGHQHDEAYNNVILHVVATDDLPVTRADGSVMPVLELAHRIPSSVSVRYHAMLECLDWIPCEKSIPTIEPSLVSHWLNRVAIERLQHKAGEVNDILAGFRGNWEDAFYIWLARNFGFKVNALPFELLARAVPRSDVSRCRNKPDIVQAFYFGQAGFLEKSSDSYTSELAEQYRFLQKKFQLQPLSVFMWKFLRMRPANFPTLRIAQFASLMCDFDRLFSMVLYSNDNEQLRKWFHTIQIPTYWETHYRFGQETAAFSPGFSSQTISNLMINSFSVFLMAYGQACGSPAHVTRAINMLEGLAPEINAVVCRFNEIGVRAGCAMESQGMLELKKSYCEAKKCLSCGIGMKILSL